MSAQAKNLEAISKAIDQHNDSCEWPAVAVAMNPFEIERLGWDEIRGLPIVPDPDLGTGAFRIVCDNIHKYIEEKGNDAAQLPGDVTPAISAVSNRRTTANSAGAGW